MIDPTETPADLLSRRKLIRAGLGGAAGLLAAPGLAWAASPTPPQTEGPFHPFPAAGVDRRIIRWADRDADLTFVDDRPGSARGTLIYLVGRVLDEQDRPIAGASLEIWQACISGRYNHRNDPSREWLDPAFQYFGRTTSDAQGNYRFRTIVPGAYLAAPNWIRPPHVHFKVARSGFRPLTSQLFFRGVQFYYARRFYDARVLDQLNLRDHVLLSVPPALRERVTTTAREVRADEVFQFEPSARVCELDIVLARSPGSPVATPELDD